MKQVAKYNLCKGVSTVLTVGTPIATLALQGELFVHRSSTAISAAGIFAVLLSLMFCKDKLVKQKVPSAFVMSLIIFVFILLVEKIILPIKYVCLTTMCATGIDELTFKRIYTTIEATLPQQAATYTHVGFIFAKTKTLLDIQHKE